MCGLGFLDFLFSQDKVQLTLIYTNPTAPGYLLDHWRRYRLHTQIIHQKLNQQSGTSRCLQSFKDSEDKKIHNFEKEFYENSKILY